jgi:hypothetical protein
MATRYTAEWIAKQHVDASGEWQPDRDEIESMEFRTRAAAMRVARERGKRYGWAKVAEESRTRLSDDFGSFARWDEVRSWTFDGFGVWNENRSGT